MTNALKTPLLSDTELAVVQADRTYAVFVDLKGRATVEDFARLAGFSTEARK